MQTLKEFSHHFVGTAAFLYKIKRIYGFPNIFLDVTLLKYPSNLLYFAQFFSKFYN
ncbi:hypothetical protein BH20ACI4_BH20ACI4_03210 [soil metagenome]